MSNPTPQLHGSCPLSREEVVQRYFLEHRQKVIDVAAFLDRVDRADAAAQSTGEDYRLRALYRALEILRDGNAERARRVLEVLSDTTSEPATSTHGLGPATGAPSDS